MPEAKYINFPFTAIVGQDLMKRALILNAVDPHIGGVLIRGERGTAKSTAARALADLLPREIAVDGCRFGCDPADSAHWCSECHARFENGSAPESVERPTPFINLPVSATEDRVVGTLDIEKAITEGQKFFEPGILAGANRGILYVDEVNLLDDHVVDILLDSAAMGVNRVEREGISFTHPARFILIGTMNPEEGDLRPQLLDRFALSVDIKGIPTTEERVEIMRRHIAFESDPTAFSDEWQETEAALTAKIRAARALLPRVTYNDQDLFTIATLSTALGVEGHRADLVILKTAIAQAAYHGRTQICSLDIADAAELALPHRLQKGPFSESGVSAEELRKQIEKATENHAELTETDGSEFDESEKKI